MRGTYDPDFWPKIWDKERGSPHALFRAASDEMKKARDDLAAAQTRFIEAQQRYNEASREVAKVMEKS